jgi:hypothetical protein
MLICSGVAEPLGKAPFKSSLAQRTIFGSRYMKKVFINKG